MFLRVHRRFLTPLIPACYNNQIIKNTSSGNIGIKLEVAFLTFNKYTDMRQCYYLLALLLISSCGSYFPVSYNSQPTTEFRGETYDQIVENEFKNTTDHPLSTFAIDVDGASYSNIRRMINDGHLPPPEAVRIEEMINYFNYDYPEPTGDNAFSISTEVGSAPWNQDHQLLHIGIQGKHFEPEQAPSSNLVFLIDVSGSMDAEDKLPLLKKGFQLLVEQLDEDDFVSIVTYSGKTRIELEPTRGSEKDKILRSISGLKAGGYTAGGKGIQKAYKLALENYNEFANNRIILATDGDFNVGVSSDEGLIDLIESKRDQGIYISVLSFGTGNLRDSKMEKIADHGNGNYFYIDNLLEAQKVLVTELNSTLHTIAKDVKIQVEFNPSNVYAYRLIGYENRILAAEDFNDNTKDAGELGAGHSVTALYEIVPSGTEMVAGLFDTDPLRYIYNENVPSVRKDELLTLKLRYKEPDATQSQLVSSVVNVDDISSSSSNNFMFSASVASFGMLLRDSAYKGNSDYTLVKALANAGESSDEYGYRAEFLRLVEHAQLLQK